VAVWETSLLKVTDGLIRPQGIRMQ
jgi:hypothetical protein